MYILVITPLDFPPQRMTLPLLLHSMNLHQNVGFLLQSFISLTLTRPMDLLFLPLLLSHANSSLSFVTLSCCLKTCFLLAMQAALQLGAWKSRVFARRFVSCCLARSPLDLGFTISWAYLCISCGSPELVKRERVLQIDRGFVMILSLEKLGSSGILVICADHGANRDTYSCNQESG
jgi:hypothetical protein